MNAKSGLTLLCGTPSRDGTFFPIRQLGIRETGRLHKLGLVGTHSIAAAKSQQAWEQFGQKVYKRFKLNVQLRCFGATFSR